MFIWDIEKLLCIRFYKEQTQGFVAKVFFYIKSFGNVYVYKTQE